jgi:hypothetical protein
MILKESSPFNVYKVYKGYFNYSQVTGVSKEKAENHGSSQKG